jgi:hypothetical protein
VVAEIVLDGEGKVGEIRQLAKIVRMNACRVEAAAVERNVEVGVVEDRPHPAELEGRQLIARSQFNGFQVGGMRMGHGTQRGRLL